MEKSLFKINAEGINNSNLQQDNNENISSSIEETAITSKKESINVETIVDDTSLNFAVSSDTEKVDVIQQEATDNTSTDKAETTKERGEAFLKAYNRIKENVRQELLKGKSPRINGAPATAMTKEQIAKIKDPVKRVQAIRDNLSQYEK